MSAHIVSKSQIDALVHFYLSNSPYKKTCIRDAQSVIPNPLSGLVGDPRGYCGEYTDEQVKTAIGKYLYAENGKSVHYRYKDSRPECQMPMSAVDALCNGYEFTERDEDRCPKVSAVEALALCRNLDYQSCEHPTYSESVGYKLLRLIEAWAISGAIEGQPWGNSAYSA